MNSFQETHTHDMKTISILEYDHDGHEFFPSFVVHDDLSDSDTVCAFDEMVVKPSQKWMKDYLQWNQFGRLPDDPILEDDEHLDSDHTKFPVFKTLEELHEFNAKGKELADRLSCELAGNQRIRVAPYKPLYSDMAVGPIAAWWHVRDRNYDFVVPVQRLPISDCLKARLQAFRYRKSLGLWRDRDTRHALRAEGQELEQLLLQELNAKPPTSYSPTYDKNKTTGNKQPLEVESIEYQQIPSGSSRSVKHNHLPHIHAAVE